MKHKWERIEDDCMHPVGTIKQWRCKVCGCIKALANHRFAEPDYIRNGQMYTHYIECIDYELEDSKTID